MIKSGPMKRKWKRMILPDVNLKVSEKLKSLSFQVCLAASSVWILVAGWGHVQTVCGRSLLLGAFVELPPPRPRLPSLFRLPVTPILNP